MVPEIASRKHVEAIAALTDKALADAGVTKRDIDAVAVTYAPGLIGAVLVGLSFAKSVAYALGVPLIPVHHIRGHIAANYLAFPGWSRRSWRCACPAATRCSWTCGIIPTLFSSARRATTRQANASTRPRVCSGCPYPGGKPMDELAQQSAGGVYDLPRASIEGHPLDMSFSGLKTAVVNLAHNARAEGRAARPRGARAGLYPRGVR